MPVSLSTPETEKAHRSEPLVVDYLSSFVGMSRCRVPPGESLAGHTVTREHTVLNYLGLTTISAHAHSWIHRNAGKTTVC